MKRAGSGCQEPWLLLEGLMSMHPAPAVPVPEETARVAHAAFPRGNAWIALRDAVGPIYDDASFAPLFARRGRPAEAPWRLALVTVMQFAEGLSDRQATEAGRARIDWKYALGLELTDPGFNFSVLSEFRGRLIDGSAEHTLLERLLTVCRERGWLKARGRQRTDSTHVLGALRVLNRLERVAETLRAALNALAAEAPDWLRSIAPPEWHERYDRRIEDYRLPRGREARLAYAATVGADGARLVEALMAANAPEHLAQLPAVDMLRRIWSAELTVVEGQRQLRDPKALPAAADQIETPYEPEARYATKRELHWVGYKVHLTETCDNECPYLLTHVETTVAPAGDIHQLATIHQGLAKSELLPAQHLVDAGYVRAQNLVEAREHHQVDVVGPIPADHQWQAKAKTDFDVSQFAVDWDAQVVRCPRGRASVRWTETHTARGRTMTRVEFAAADCGVCPVRPQCTRARTTARSLLLQPREEHEMIQAVRKRQQTTEYATTYAQRAGVEGTLSQGVRAFGLRRARYRGLARTHLQHVATAAAMNVDRLVNWLDEVPQAQTRRSRFAALDPAA
jgi:transposase